MKGQYVPVFPVFLVGDDPAQLRFRVAFEDRALVGLPALGVAEASVPERRWREIDGPMLECGLQGFDGQAIVVPKATSLRPSAAFLAERYERFRKAG